MLCEILDDRNAAPQIRDSRVLPISQYLRGECANEGIQEGQSLSAEIPDSKVEFGIQPSSHDVSQHPTSIPIPDQDPACPRATAHCASHIGCKGHPRTANWRFLQSAAPAFSVRRAPPMTGHSPPTCSRQGPCPDYAAVFQKRW